MKKADAKLGIKNALLTAAVILSLFSFCGCDSGDDDSSEDSEGDDDDNDNDDNNDDDNNDDNNDDDNDDNDDNDDDSSDADSDSDTDSDGDSDGDSDTDSDGDSDGDFDMCEDYPEPQNNFDLGSVIRNYVFYDKNDDQFEICELSNQGKKTLLMRIVNREEW